MNKLHSKDFEILTCIYHQKTYNQITIPWFKCPDFILILLKLFDNLEDIRLFREKNYKQFNMFSENMNIFKRKKEYGLDAISMEILDDKFIFHGLQMKLWNDDLTLDASHLGTFLDIIFNVFDEKESHGYLYYTCKIGNTFLTNCKKKNKIIPIKVDNPFHNIKINSKSLQLRYYQIDAIETLKKDWFGNKLLVLPCGTGKTIICANYCKEMSFSNIFIISPTIILTEQNYDRFSEVLTDYNKILIETNQCRDINEIKNCLNKKYIFSITFDSFEDLFEDILNNDKIDFNNSILIIDEAHNLLNRKKIIKMLDHFSKCLLVSATPPFEIKNILNCDIIYEYKLNKAIDDKYICDYDVYLPYIENIEIPLHLLEFDNNLCKKGLFLINGMLEKGCRNCIIFLKNRVECKNFEVMLNEIMNKYHYYECIIDTITCDTSKKDRIEIINKFEEFENKEIIKIILSIRILDEGIDFIRCDSIFLTNVGDKNNDIRNTQRIMRSNRIDILNPNKKASIFIWCDDFDKGLDTIKLLKMNDYNFHKKIKYDNIKYTNKNSDKNKIINEEINIQNIELSENIKISILTPEEILYKKKNILFDICNNLKRCINKNDKKHVEIYKWYIEIKNNYIKNNKNEYYKILSKNIYIKNNLDNSLETSYYECLRCKFKTKYKNDMRRHLDRIVKCGKILDAYFYNDEELYLKSLTPIKEEVIIDNKSVIEEEKKEKVKSDKILNCEFCNKKFQSSYNVKRHQKTSCKKEDRNTIQNQNNTQNNIIIKSENGGLKSFYEDWSVEHIDNYLKMVMLLSKTKYTDFLTEVMKNKENLNVIIDKNSESGLVYKNKQEMYVKLKMKEILEQSMIKLNNQLQKLFNECLDNKSNMHDNFINLIKDEKDNNNIKFSDYMSNINFRHDVNTLLLDILNKKKADAINVAKNISNKLEY